MPEPPHVGWLTRYVLENPYPLGLVMVAIAAGVAWTALRDGRAVRLKAAAVLAILGGAVLLTGAVVTTSGEHAEGVTRRLVEDAANGDVAAVVGQLADGALLAFGSPRNPGFGLDSIEDRLIRLTDRHPIQTNRITMLAGYSESGDAATVHLATTTEVRDGYGPILSKWVLKITRQDDAAWKVRQITCVSVNGRTPRPDPVW